MKIYAPAYINGDGFTAATNSLPSRPRYLPLDELRTIMSRHCGSYERIPFLLHIAHGYLDDDDWTRLLFEEWPSADNLGCYIDDLIDDTPLQWVLNDPAAYHHLTMTDVERAAYDALPDEIEVWRGCYAANKWGLSWSLDQRVASLFPFHARYRQNGHPLLIRARARKLDILAVKLDRAELEVVTWRPTHISTRHLSEKVHCAHEP